MAAASGSELRTVFSLGDNRLLAHLVRQGGLAIPLGHPGVAKYLNFSRPWNPWEANRREDGRRVALATRSVTWLSFPLTAAQAKASTLTLSLKSPAAQVLRVSVNGGRPEGVKLTAGWQRATAQLPAGGLKAGENKLTFTWGAGGRMGGTRASAAVEWLHLGSTPPGESEPMEPAAPGGLSLPANGGLAYYVFPYKGAKLRLRYTAPPADRACDPVVTMIPEGKSPSTARLEPVRPGAPAELVIDLAPMTEQVGRLELTATGARCQGLTLTDGAIVMPGPQRTLSRVKPPKNVLFWLIDNARADRYKVYNPKTRVEAPVIEELGKTGTVFTRAYIAGTESRVSHASIWTGLYPRQHRFIDPKAKLAPSFFTMPEGAKKAGLYTAAWVANGWISKFWGFGEGWDYLRNTLHQGGGLSGKDLADHAIQFIGEKGGKRFFVYVGTIDVHVSWRAREPWLSKYHPEPYKGPYQKAVWGKDVEKMAGGKQVSPADKKRILAVYDSTVSFNDAQLGRVLKALEAKGIRKDTMVVVTADHGEELWDFGRIGHGHSCRNPLVAVPFIVHYPPLFGSGVRVREGVDVLSAMGTIFDALGVPLPENVQGASLMPLAQGVEGGYPRPAMATQYELAHTIRLEDYKLWVGGKGEPTLFDLASAKGERDDISARQPTATRWLTDALSTFLIYQTRWRQARWGVASNLRAAMAEDLEQGKGPGPIKP
ncbi:MAG: sulfatase-like hydrolase/transferase [Deltaproteobacteria bacterium]|nr:sulfatase-like hydrolase/transferase [Deltaproteobacteria bacterium]